MFRSIFILLLLSSSYAFALNGDMGASNGADGTEGNPWLIEDFEDFQAFSDDSSKWASGVYTQLECDLDLDPALDGRQIYSQALVAADAFYYGIFIGNDYTIRNVKIDGNGACGLFGRIGVEGTVSNLAITNISVSGNEWGISALASLNYGTINNCYVKCSIFCYKESVSLWSGAIAGTNSGIIKYCVAESQIKGKATYIGGLVGENSGIISLCISSVNVDGEASHIGGLVGRSSYRSIISDSYSVGNINNLNDGCIGGLVGSNSNDKILRCYSACIVSGSNEFTGGLVGDGSGNISNCYFYKYNYTFNEYGKGLDDNQLLDKYFFIGFDFAGDTSDGTEDIWTIEQGYMPRLAWQDSPGYEPPYILDTITTALSGKGTKAEPFLIANKNDLLEFRNNSALRIGNYTLMNNVDLNGTTFPDAFIPQSFTGDFDGSSHIIYNLEIEGDSNLGFFSKLYGSVNEFNLLNTSILGTGNYIGGIAGEVITGGISNCNSTGKIYGNSYVGGLIGKNSGSNYKGYSSVEVNGIDRYIGGLIGSNEGDCTKSFSSGTITGRCCVGGLVGGNRSNARITKCYSTGNVRCTMEYEEAIGGFCGWNVYGSIICYCYSRGNVLGSNYPGGFCGVNNEKGNIYHCYSTGQVYGSEASFGFCGSNGGGTINGCFWDTEASGLDISSGGTGLSTDSMQSAAPYLNAYWDFYDETANGTDDIWFVRPGEYPKLMWQVDISGQPEGDFFNDPLTANCGFLYSGENTGAYGLDLTAYGYKDYADIWHRFDVKAKGTYDIDLSGSSFDTTLAVFDDKQIEIVFNDDFEDSIQSRVTLKAEANTTYYIRVSGYNDSQGAYKLFISNPNHASADFNSDNAVDIYDLSAVASSWLENYTFDDLKEIVDNWLGLN